MRKAQPLAGILAALLVTTGTPSTPVRGRQTGEIATVSSLQFHSDFWMNLHHVLYAAAWSNRPQAGTLRALAGALPAPLDPPFTDEERSTWRAAVEYYDRELAGRDLLFGRGMMSVKDALVAGDLSRDAIGPDLQRILESTAPIYRRYFWFTHDRANRQWTNATVEQVKMVGPDLISRLEKFYGVGWFPEPVRVDVVWVGNRQGAYTTDGPPPHVTISSGDPDNSGWTGLEIVFHEVSHVLVLPLQNELETALGPQARTHEVLWHVIQFYVTGSAVQQTLKARSIDYVPYMYSTGLFDRAWSRYRAAVEANWGPYVQGTVTRAEAIAGTVRDLRR
jgi:hypothetical protein